MKQKTKALLVLVLCLVLMGAAVAVGLWYFGVGGSQPVAQSQELVLPGEQEESVREKHTPEEREKPRRDSAVIPAQSFPAGEDYFADAAFLVNSVSMGLDLYDYDGLLRQADFYGTENLTAFDAMDFIRDMEEGDYGKVYIALGINDLWRDIDALRLAYTNMIEELMTYSADSIIVLVSVPPVSAYRSQTNQNYTQKLVTEYNEMLYALAEEWGVWYLDANTALADEKGFLPSEVTEDGMHFTPAHYENWFQCLVWQYVNDGTVTPDVLPAEASAEASSGTPAP